MDIPLEVINAVTPHSTQEPSKKVAKKRAPYVKKMTKRILHAIGNGLRTPTSIANALNVPKAKIQSNLSHLKTRGLLYSHKQVNSNEHKYHLTTDKPVLGQLDLTPKKKAKKNAYIYNRKEPIKTPNPKSLEKVEPQPLLGKYARELEVKLADITNKLASLEHTLIEKEKEVWTLECEVFDKKAVIKYLEEKLFALGVRV